MMHAPAASLINAEPIDLPHRPIPASRRQALAFLFLFLAFDLGYILPPYWLLPKRVVWKAVAFVITGGVGLLGAALGSGILRRLPRGNDSRPAGWRWKGPLDGWMLGVIAALTGALNFSALVADVPWRGDEILHIVRTGSVGLMPLRHPIEAACLLCIAILFFAYLTRRRPIKKALIVACSILLLVQALPMAMTGADSFYGYDRYPYLAVYPSVVPVMAVGILGQNSMPWHSSISPLSYRLLPLLCTIFLAWAAAGLLPERRWLLRLLLALVIVTTPLVFYYTSILYLEMPAVLLMTVVCLAADSLLSLPAEELPAQPAWYALLLIGYVKETGLPFLAVFVGLRIVVAAGIHWRRRPARWGSWLKLAGRETAAAFCVLCPFALCMAYRRVAGVWRTSALQWRQLADPALYRYLLHSYAVQFSPLLVLAAAGLVLLMWRRQYRIAGFLVMAFCADAAFHLVDYSAFVGYSRFNLFLLPPLIAAASFFAAHLARRGGAGGRWKTRGLILAGVLTAALAVNFRLSPVYLDGTKVPHWGNDLCDTSEHYYPYRAALSWVNDHARGRKVLIAGLNWAYSKEVYLDREIDVSAPIDESAPAIDDPQRIEAALKAAGAQQRNLVVLHLYGTRPPQLRQTYGFVQTRMFANQAHVLAIYERAEDGDAVMKR